MTKEFPDIHSREIFILYFEFVFVVVFFVVVFFLFLLINSSSKEKKRDRPQVNQICLKVICLRYFLSRDHPVCFGCLAQYSF